MEINNIIFSLFLIFLGYSFKKYFLLVLKKSKSSLLADNQFEKPQAFHEKPVYRLGGIVFFSLLVLVFSYLFFLKEIFLLEYISFCTLFFLLGLVDDLKINIRPKFRLLAMIVILFFLVIYNNFYIEKSGLSFLNNLLDIDIFALFFVCLCFLFIVNGANLIDGFNGLLGIHSLIIFIILFVINLISENSNLSYILFFISLLTLIVLKFNFPNAQIFLGDSGAYLLGSLIAVSAIKTSILNPSISPFFFCILLFYLFFEVFFSFFRKIFIVRQSPLFPDNKHLHMSLYKLLLKKYKVKVKSNYTVSMYINLIYLLLILPAIIFINNGLFCRFYFFFLIIIYIYSYNILNKKT
tara:strand:- start:316 stop:1371 length:1056 start_codon:yes stop_codon:yes gene_type:complete